MINLKIHFDPCPACPRIRAGIPGPCLAQLTNHKHYCDRAAAGDHGHDATLCRVELAAPMPTLPPLLDQVVNFGRSVFTHVRAGMPKAPPETVAARLAICDACPNLIRPDRRCGLLAGQGKPGCGCYVDTKATWLDQDCPAKPSKWPNPMV